MELQEAIQHLRDAVKDLPRGKQRGVLAALDRPDGHVVAAHATVRPQAIVVVADQFPRDRKAQEIRLGSFRAIDIQKRLNDTYGKDTAALDVHLFADDVFYLLDMVERQERPARREPSPVPVQAPAKAA